MANGKKTIEGDRIERRYYQNALNAEDDFPILIQMLAECGGYYDMDDMLDLGSHNRDPVRYQSPVNQAG